LGECEVIAYIGYANLDVVGQAIEAGLATYGYYDIPIGINKSDTSGYHEGDYWVDFFGGDHLATDLINLCRMSTPYPDAIAVSRTAIGEQPDNSVTYVITGGYQNLRNLYDSAANFGGDGYGNGSSLIAAKIREFVVWGGDYPTGEIYGYEAPNSQVMNDIAGLGIRVIWEGDTLGGSVEYDVTTAADYSYVKMALRISAVGDYTRQAWAAAMLLYTVRGFGFGGTNYIGSLSPEGKNVVEADGENNWTVGDYNQWYLLTLGVTNSAFATIISGLGCAAPSIPLQKQVAASTDDIGAYKASDTTWTAEATNFYRVAVGTATAYSMYKLGSGLRFLNVAVPDGAQIIAARLVLNCSAAMSTTTVK
jgi:hypothetical protein